MVHPVLQEFILTSLRLIAIREMRYNRLKAAVAYGVVEEILVVQRRIMVGAMRDPMAAVLTIIFTALEEALLRCTLAYRDELWHWLRGLPTPSEMQMEDNRRRGGLVGHC